MTYEDRKKIIEEIEEIRKTKVLVYVTSTKPNIKSMIEPRDLRFFYDHLNDESFSGKDIDLFLYSNGGVSTVAWALTNLIRSFTKKFSVLVPYNAFSCATAIALGADEIVMSKMGTLGPIDPTVSNQFNPVINNTQVGISVEDMGGYISLLKEKFGISDTDNLTKAFSKLAGDIRPLALGNAYRHYVKCREDAKKLLSLHFDPETDSTKIENIVSILVEKLYFHEHHVNREEATKIGLNVIKPEDISERLHELMWDLYLDYETEMDLLVPYEDNLPVSGDISEIPLKAIESTLRRDTYICEQKWVNMGFSEDCKLFDNNGQIAIYVPPNQVLSIRFQGSPAFVNGLIYDKQETLYWK